MIEGWNEKRKESDELYENISFNGGIKAKGIKIWQHNQTGHIACLSLNYLLLMDL
jgi:hypothetical protein